MFAKAVRTLADIFVIETILKYQLEGTLHPITKLLKCLYKVAFSISVHNWLVVCLLPSMKQHGQVKL